MSQSQSHEEGASVRRAHPPGAVWVLACVGLAALAVALLLASGAGDASTAAGRAQIDMKGNAVELQDPIGDPTVLERMRVSEDDGERLQVPSVALDVPLGSLDLVEGAITPPGFSSAYVVRNVGTPNEPTAGTTYVAMHSIPAPGLAPGNFLIDVDSGMPSVSPGARVVLGDETYAVDSAYTVDKDELPSREDVWKDVPGRLVVITCQQLPSGAPSVQNSVIEAHLVDR
ncbi:class F sortase [Microbacterium halophytorum]|uniref:class F sortase n=1 Tax=Microbacterium halophytorum TaxID=2067568 RepID=UPI00131A170F|nr:class F sortase [Microbacterium halophytorum]